MLKKDFKINERYELGKTIKEENLIEEITKINVKKLGFVADSGKSNYQIEKEKRRFIYKRAR